MSGVDTAAMVSEVEEKAAALCDSIKQATEAGVPDALVLPALFATFKAAGMLPESLDLGMLGGLFR